MKTATWMKDLSGWRGNASLYHLSQPIISHLHPDPIEYIVVSAVKDDWIHETYIFEAVQDGMVQNYTELNGSQKNTTSHDDVLNGIGYEIIKGLLTWQQ